MSTFARPVMYGDLSRWALVMGDSLRLLGELPDSTVDAVVTDPPYGISFVGEGWDGDDLADPLGFQAFSESWAREIGRVLKPGGHVLAFGSPRTFHRLIAGCEDAGLQIRDLLLWLHGRGVPKSKLLPSGISTTLKPAYEPIMLARKALPRGVSVKANIAKLGTGGLNIDATRIPDSSRAVGYWPSHIILSHEEDCQDGGRCEGGCAVALIDSLAAPGCPTPSRLFYIGKASRAERETGLENLPHTDTPVFGVNGLTRTRANVHPTVKPIDLMRWLIRLITPEGGLVLDPFTGSGSTGVAAIHEQRRFFGIELEDRYIPIAKARLTHATTTPPPARTEPKRR